MGDNTKIVFPEVGDFITRWEKKLETEIQITMNMKPGPNFEPKPWDNLLIKLEGNELRGWDKSIRSRRNRSSPKKKRPSKRPSCAYCTHCHGLLRQKKEKDARIHRRCGRIQRLD